MNNNYLALTDVRSGLVPVHFREKKAFILIDEITKKITVIKMQQDSRKTHCMAYNFFFLYNIN